ncbi:MAG TPA: choice-of-anchor D domain-containing protein, partial [Kofleriaceae bacterium]|nr:choice-of-anchor D domain-containing protein [Kofleriaceae bacterium]
MTTRRWVEVSFAFFIVISLTRIAGAVVITPSAASVNVGNVTIGSPVTNSTLTLTSDTQNYDVDVVVSGCSGTGTGTFTVLVNGKSTAATLKTTSINTVDVTYTPTTRGTQSCRVDVYTTGTMTPSLAFFTVNATGVAPVVSAPATVTFGAVRYNDAATVHTATMNVVISNTGDAGQVLTINNLTFTGTNAGDYTISAAPALPANINPGSNQTWVITFNPLAAGASAATLNIDSNDPITPTKTVAVTGTGGTGVISVTTPLNFGTVTQGSTSTAQNIVVSNVGTGSKGTLTVTGATFINNSAGWFKFNNGAGCNGTTTCTLSMALTTNTGTVPVVCAPPANATGSMSASISFTSDTDDNTLSTTTVNCTAGHADIMVTTTPLNFGNQLINTSSAAQTVMIANIGNATLNYSVALAGTNPGQFTLAGAGGCVTNCAVSAGSSVMVSVYFTPNNVGAKNALLRVTALNDANNPPTSPIDVTLTGTCVAPAASVNPTTMAFGNIDVGATATAQTLTLTNTGTATLTLSAAYLQLGAADYVTTGTTGSAVSISVPPSGTATWTIACKPSAPGARNGTFRITSDSGNVAGTNTDVPLTCNGLKGNLVVAVTPYDFGGVREGTMVSQTFTLTNNGNTT